jgi:hypothetical protein
MGQVNVRIPRQMAPVTSWKPWVSRDAARSTGVGHLATIPADRSMSAPAKPGMFSMATTA